MENEALINDIIEINRRVCYNLWNVAKATDIEHSPNGLSPRLILPKVRDKDSARISEQESRVLYCGVLNMLNYYYSIETPTEKDYQQTGQTRMSAASDLSLYSYNNQFNKVVNVEFKAHNPITKHISKDIEKLISENITGNWFHTLKNIDSKTLGVLFAKFIISFGEHKAKAKHRLSFIFCICVMDKKWACIKPFSFDPETDNDLVKYVENFFTLGYEASAKSKAVNVTDNNGWHVLKLLK
jgi:WD40 repeat protein